jgi:hypothetical protein
MELPFTHLGGHMNDTSLPPRPLKPIVIPVEDESEMTHQPPYYFCSKPDCPCHQDPELTSILHAMLDADEVTPEQALGIFWNQQEGDTRS